MTMPNFLIIGAGKSGTTSLYYYLKQHPQVYMSPVKEPKFFAVEGMDLNFRGPDDEISMNRKSVNDIERYQMLFREVTNERAIGEASTLYLHSSEAPFRIKHYIPKARLIAVLRNPVERAYSQFLHFVRDGQEPTTDFAQALREEETRVRDNWAPRWRNKYIGFYHAHLERYYNLFDRDQIMIHLYEDLRNDPATIVRSTYGFVGVDDAFAPDVSLKHNISGMPKSRALQTLIGKPNPLKAAVKPLIPEKVRRRISVSLQTRNISGSPPLDPSIRRDLMGLYREDILKLQDLIDRDLSMWLEG
jgi:hypothetical protein